MFCSLVQRGINHYEWAVGGFHTEDVCEYHSIYFLQCWTNCAITKVTFSFIYKQKCILTTIWWYSSSPKLSASPQVWIGLCWQKYQSLSLQPGQVVTGSQVYSWWKSNLVQIHEKRLFLHTCTCVREHCFNCLESGSQLSAEVARPERSKVLQQEDGAWSPKTSSPKFKCCKSCQNI